MFSKTIIALFAATAALAQQINTPAALIQCQPAQLTFSGGSPPYIIAVLPGGQVSAAAISTIGTGISGSPLTWNVNLASGTNITLRITDSQGAIGYSSPSVIQQGTSNACLNASASTSGVATTGAITTTGSSNPSASGGSLSSVSSQASATSSASRASSASSSGPASSASMAASSAASGAGASASSASNVASSAAASATSRSGAYATGVAGAGAIAAGVMGGVALFL